MLRSKPSHFKLAVLISVVSEQLDWLILQVFVNKTLNTSRTVCTASKFPLIPISFCSQCPGLSDVRGCPAIVTSASHVRFLLFTFTYIVYIWLLSTNYNTCECFWQPGHWHILSVRAVLCKYCQNSGRSAKVCQCPVQLSWSSRSILKHQTISKPEI